MAMEDPHLMRLGHYLEHLEGPEEVARLLNDGIDLDELEKAFLKEPWKAGLSIVRVVDPTGRVKPFIEVDNIQGKDHQHCPFHIYTMLCSQESESSDNEQGGHIPKVVGLSVETNYASLPKFKPWEKRECRGELRKMLSWRVKTRSQSSPKHTTKVAQASKPKKSESEKKVSQPTVKMTKAILKILTKSRGPKVHKKTTNAVASVNNFCGSRDFVSEQMQTRKVRFVKRKRDQIHEPSSSKKVSSIQLFVVLSFFLALQDSSIGDIVSN